MAQEKNGMPERKSGMAQETVVEGYGCICGFTTQDKVDFTRHLMLEGKRDGKGTHKSLGRINITTGEVTLLPWEDRSPEDREKTKFSGLDGAGDNGEEKSDKSDEKSEKSDEKSEKSGKSGKSNGKGPKVTKPDPSILQTTTLENAQEIRVVPRIYTMDYSPMMRAGQDAATRLWGWRPNMPLGNFIDTVLYLFFEEKGVTLCGYIVNDSLLEKEAQQDDS